MTDPQAQLVPAKQVNPISPLLPISVLLVSAAQSFNLLHKHCLRSPFIEAWAQTCESSPRQYITHPAFGTLDTITCVLVEFFSAAVNDVATNVLAVEFLCLFGTMLLIGYISANRSSAGKAVRWGTTAAFMLAQLLGAAVVYPVYVSMIVYKGSTSARASFVPSAWARTLLPAVFVSFIVPSLVLVFPKLLSTDQTNMVIAVWQLFPIAFTVVSSVLALCLTGSGHSLSTSDMMVSTALIISSMDFMVLISFLAHLYAVYLTYANSLAPASFVPDSALSSPLAVTKAFFTFDFVGCMVATWTLIFYDTSRFASVGRTSLLSAAFIALFGTLLLGPGGSAAWAWSNIEKARLRALVADRPRKANK